MADKEDYERKRISVITVTGGMIFSVLAMVAGSWLGTAGTLYGAAFGSGFSAIGGTIYENMARKAHAKMKARKEQERAETQVISPAVREALIRNRETFIASREKDILRQQRRDPWKIAAMALGSLGLFIVVAMATLLGVEVATGQTLHSLLPHHGTRQYGTSFSYSTAAPPTVTVTPSLVPSSPLPSLSSPSAAPDATPDASPDQTPGGVPSTIGLTGTPTSSASATSSPSEQTAPAANAVPSSSSATGLSAAGTTVSRRRREGAWREHAREESIISLSLAILTGRELSISVPAESHGHARIMFSPGQIIMTAQVSAGQLMRRSMPSFSAPGKSGRVPLCTAIPNAARPA